MLRGVGLGPERSIRAAERQSLETPEGEYSGWKPDQLIMLAVLVFIVATVAFAVWRHSTSN